MKEIETFLHLDTKPKTKEEIAEIYTKLLKKEWI